MNNKSIYTGIGLIILGVLFLLYNLAIFDLSWILFIVSVALLVRYFLKREIVYLITGLGLFAFSSLSLIDRYIFIVINIKPFVYLFVAGCGSIYLYIKSHEKNWIVVGSIFISFALNNIIGQVWPIFLPWGKFFLLGLAFYLCYLVAYRGNYIVWPKYISYVMCVIGIIQILVNKDLFRLANNNISYLIPAVIIIIGLGIIYISIDKRY